ncbi:MAG TPA: NAD(P)H-dependent oxidoreductase [Methylocella sp.]|nr:NAD(P)H-dependent oxidoreductase [Methylocella sp.]
MARRIAIIQGHPDAAGHHLCHALADAYAKGAEAAGHQVLRIETAQLDFPLLRTREEFNRASAPSILQPAQEAIANADHLVIIYPLWLGSMPALLKAFLEQVFRPGFAFELTDPAHGKLTRLLKGKSARVIVTMGMPAFIYRWYFGAHGLRSLERNILRFCGIGPIKESLVGMVDTMSDAKREKWLANMAELGRLAA